MTHPVIFELETFPGARDERYEKVESLRPGVEPPEGIVLKLRSMGYAFSSERGLTFSYCRKVEPPREAIPLLRDLKAHLANGWVPRDPCTFCRACGSWPDHEGGPFCFYDTVFLGKGGNSKPIKEVKECPRMKPKKSD
ncbi:MAG: hypothetical protein ACFFCW_06355 [Candidatus Hodarchaeota archaeon]